MTRIEHPEQALFLLLGKRGDVHFASWLIYDTINQKQEKRVWQDVREKKVSAESIIS